MIAGARVEVAPYKRDPMDFVLWKPSVSAQPGWDSPWGYGRPGWHVECSAMIGKHLGHTIDIHGGGQDLIFPHHENEIAQGTCAHGTLYCRTWVHNSFVTVDGQKMSKSLGNVLLVRDLLQQAPGEAIRLALLSTHYRHPLDWNERRLTSARQMLTSFYDSLAKVEDISPADNVTADTQLMAALCNDLNTVLAITRLHQLTMELNSATTDDMRAEAKARLLASGEILGLLQQIPQLALRELQETATKENIVCMEPAQIEALINGRNEARQQRDFTRADALRDELAASGIILEDTPQGTIWRPMAETSQWSTGRQKR